MARQGWALNPSKTRVAHTLQVEAGEARLDFLGFNIRPYPTQSTRAYKTIIKPSREAMARHQRQLRAVVHRHRMDTQERVIEALNPGIHGWSHDVSTVYRLFLRLQQVFSFISRKNRSP